MSLDPSKPSDSALVSELAAYIREDRVAINSVVSGAGFGVTNLDIAAGTTSLSVGTDLLAVGHEIVIVTGLGVAVLATILGGTDGQIKTFIFQDANIDLIDGAKSNGKFYLNQLPALSNFEPQQDDVLTLVNIGGDGASVYGYWKELYRNLSIK